MTNATGRLVRANLSLTLDGRYSGPGGAADIGAIVPYMTTAVARRQLARIHTGATTALLGRGSAEGFLGFWGEVAEDVDADPRDRGYAAWLLGADKIVFSTSLTEAPWERTRIVNAPVPHVVAELKTSGRGDILANTSPSIIKPLLEADLIDRLYLMIVPEIVSASGEMRKAMTLAMSSPFTARPAAVPGAPWPKRDRSPSLASKNMVAERPRAGQATRRGPSHPHPEAPPHHVTLATP